MILLIHQHYMINALHVLFIKSIYIFASMGEPKKQENYAGSKIMLDAMLHIRRAVFGSISQKAAAKRAMSLFY